MDIVELADLLCRANSEWVPLPEWAESLFALGVTVGSLHSANSRTIVCVSLPTRSFAVSFVAAGAVVGRSFVLTSPSDYLRALAKLPAHTVVDIRRGNMKYRGLLDSVTLPNGQRQGEIRVLRQKPTSGGLREIIPEKLADTVEAVPEGRFKLPSKPVERQVDVHTPFLGALSAGVRPRLGETCSRLDCVIVGNTHVIREDLYSLHVAVCSSGTLLRGTLGDLVRVHRFGRTFSSYRSQVYSPLSPEVLRPLASPVRPVFIIDGSTAFLRVDTLPGDLVIVLDRTSRDYAEAVSRLNLHFLSRTRHKEPSLAGHVYMSAGQELMLWEEPL